MSNRLVVKSSPHLKSPMNTQVIMRDVIIALMPAFICSIIIFGLRSLLLVTVCVASCVVFEYLSRMLMKRENSISDLSAVVTGLLLAFNLPVTFPLWMAVIGAFFAIVIAKQLFGGLGQNFVNPAIAGRIFLLISFATPMTSWLLPQKGEGGIALVAGATPLALIGRGEKEALPALTDMLLGMRGGCLGETAALALLAGAVYLLVRRVIHPVIPVTFLGTVFVLSLLLGQDPLYQLLSGGVILGACFMATDYATSPATFKGRLIFAFGCGLITMIIRVFGSYPEGVSFAILFMNILTPHINTLTRTKPFGVLEPSQEGRS
ncbi:MAG: RnfABCDGE type electron transport complex subunit D [Provencibacterium sp.]|nr:RnfABCDGE type electron transport complex subunit D [Provencibacterium sp.]